jgi:hypothetical protein
MLRMRALHSTTPMERSGTFILPLVLSKHWIGLPSSSLGGKAGKQAR